jgi:nitrogenase molybdenum-iron protein NifN
MAETYVSTTNACKMCTPMGAALVFKGIENAVPFLHGSQGCATYMRRYIISHYREPVDIASSALGEKSAVYGGGPNLKKGILNVMRKYDVSLVGVATTCLTETIGDDVGRYLNEFRDEFSDLPLPELVHVSTPSYSGTHMEGWHAAVRSLADQIVKEKVPGHGGVNLLPGFLSPADYRFLKALGERAGVRFTMLPDLSETMDGVIWDDYHSLPGGGTPVSEIRAMGGAAGTIEFGMAGGLAESAAGVLERKFGVPARRTMMPIGLRGTDGFMDALAGFATCDMPPRDAFDRGRLLDAMVDGHKYIFGKRAVVYGEEDFVVALCSFLGEIGIQPVLVATGTKSDRFRPAVTEALAEVCQTMPVIRDDADFKDIEDEAAELNPDLLVGHSKGYKLARAKGIPLVRVGFPIHDRFGGQRILHVGYEGALSLYDKLVNAVLEKSQDECPVGYGYL